MRLRGEWGGVTGERMAAAGYDEVRRGDDAEDDRTLLTGGSPPFTSGVGWWLRGERADRAASIANTRWFCAVRSPTRGECVAGGNALAGSGSMKAGGTDRLTRCCIRLVYVGTTSGMLTDARVPQTLRAASRVLLALSELLTVSFVTCIIP